MKRFNLSRRAFIRLAALSGIGAGLALYRKLTEPIHPVSYLRWKIRGLYYQNFGSPAIVAIGNCPTYREADLLSALYRIWELAEMPSLAGKKVFIKPNLVDSLDQVTDITTSPQVIGAVVELLKDMGAISVKVGDGPAFRRDAWTIAREVGLSDILARSKTEFVDLNYDDPQPLSPRDGWFQGVSKIWIPRSILESDLIISLAKLKTHHWAQVSLCMKNLLGIFPGIKYGWPKNFIHFSGIAESIMGLYQVLPEVAGVLDGVVGMEGDGPLFGKPVPHGILIAGKDPVAVDEVGKDLMGFGDYEVSYLNLAAWAGIGRTAQIETRGVPLEAVRKLYQRPPMIE